MSDKMYWQVADQPGMEGPDVSSVSIQETKEEVKKVVIPGVAAGSMIQEKCTYRTTYKRRY